MDKFKAVHRIYWFKISKYIHVKRLCSFNGIPLPVFFREVLPSNL